MSILGVSEKFGVFARMEAQALLAIAENYLRTTVHPRAAAIDRDLEALRTALLGLGKYGLLALRVPQRWGGAGVDKISFYHFQESIARYSGALAFLQTQHQSAAALLAQGMNDSLKQELLPLMGRGEELVGVGFSHLRRPGPPRVRAVPVSDGYQLQGTVPWITGYGIFQAFLVGARLPDHRTLFGLVPFTAGHQAGGGRLSLSPPMDLAAMAVTNTVSATLTDWLLPESLIVAIKSSDWIDINDRRNVLKPTPLVLGCARAGLDIVEIAARAKDLVFMTDTFAALDRELTQCRMAVLQAQQSPQNFVAEQLQLRAWATELAVRCAHAAVAASSGAANCSAHAAQRVYREALVYTVSGQTTAVMAATLSRLSERRDRVVERYDKSLRYANGIPK